MKRAQLAVVLAGLSVASVAFADGFGLGNGHSGSPTVTATFTPNIYSQITANATQGGSTITVFDTTGFTGGGSPNGDLILIWQPAAFPASGLTVGDNNTAVSVDESTGAGRYELARIQSVDSGSQITIVGTLQNPYPANNSQIVKVPEYTSVTIPAGATIKPSKNWDGRSGGIVAFFASGAITFTDAASNINADRAGFRGGALVTTNDGTAATCDHDTIPSPNGGGRGENITSSNNPSNSNGNGPGNFANGGGGGDCLTSGGAGGGNAGNGGNGGVPSLAFRASKRGVKLDYSAYSLVDHMTLGGGGGGAAQTNGGGTAGAPGGGVVFLRAASIAGAGFISADGNTPAASAADDGQGGGGAGGSLVIRVQGSTNACTAARLHAVGGAGGGTTSSGTSSSGGGGGGGGRVLVQAVAGCSAGLGGGAGGTTGSAVNGANGSSGSAETPPSGGFCVDNSICAGGTPICSSGVCVPCTASTQCSLSEPICNVGNGQCNGCSGVTDCRTRDPADPICNLGTGACGTCTTNSQCAAADPTHPSCNTITGVCAKCTGDLQCEGDNPNTPFCNAVSGACEACAATGPNARCSTLSADTPFCGGGGACAGCSSNAQCAAANASFPVCITSGGSAGACAKCTGDPQCSATTPFCDAAGGACGPCIAGTTRCQALDPANAICNTGTGACGPCGSNAQCAAINTNKPFCVTGTCSPCASNAQCAAANSATPACSGSGACVACTSDTQCGSSTSGRICDTLQHLCVDGCSRAAARNNCPAGQFCTSADTTGSTTGVCTTSCDFDVDCATMATMPFCVGAGNGGVGRCAGCRNDGDCSGMTPVCEPNKTVCVQCIDAKKEFCSSTSTGAACLAAERCGCNVDGDCGTLTSGRICDTATNDCTPGCRNSGGNGCPSGQVCSGAGSDPGVCGAPNDLSTGPVDLSVPPDLSPPDLSVTPGSPAARSGCAYGGGRSPSSEGLLLILATLGLMALRLRRKRHDGI